MTVMIELEAAVPRASFARFIDKITALWETGMAQTNTAQTNLAAEDDRHARRVLGSDDRSDGRSRSSQSPATAPLNERPIVEFCGEHTIVAGSTFVIGRHGDLIVGEENGFVHRRFLVLSKEHGRWFLNNVGSGLTATVCAVGSTGSSVPRVVDADEIVGNHAILGPGASLALTQQRNRVRFSAGPTRYEFEIAIPSSASTPLPSWPDDALLTGDRTTGRMPLTRDQHLLILVLAEPVLRNGGSALASMPTSQSAANRLGWTITKFNRKLDNVCQKLQRLGVRGVHGGVGSLASQRRVRLVDHALAARLVTPDDLVLLDRAVAAAQLASTAP